MFTCLSAYVILFLMEAKKHGFRFTVIWYFSTIFLVFTAVMYIAFFALFSTTGKMQEKIDRYILLDRLSDSVHLARSGLDAYHGALEGAEADASVLLEVAKANIDKAFSVLYTLEKTTDDEKETFLLHESIVSNLEIVSSLAGNFASDGKDAYLQAMVILDDLIGSGIPDYLSLVVRHDTVESIETAIYLEKMRISIIYMIAICFAVVLLFAFMFSKNLARPVKAITESAGELAKGNYDTPELEGAEPLELASLEESINKMKKAIKERSEFEKEIYEQRVREAEMAKELNRAHYLALQAQINPHFLFNALNTISHTALFENAEKTVELTNTLALFFRYTLEFRNEVSLAEELDFCTQYLTIQKKRFSDRLDYVIGCEDGIGDVPIPPLVIEPFVENAVIHGLEPKENGGCIHVSASASMDGMVRVVVEDDGMGIEEGFEPPAQGRKGRIGIKNVEERLDLFFEGRSSVKMERIAGGGTRVEIMIPRNEGKKA